MEVIQIDKWTVPAGRVHRRVLRTNPSQEYYVYAPKSASVGAPVLVAVHGRSRNVREQADRLTAVCEARGVVLVAPHFSVDSFRDYQRLGRQGRRADEALHAIVQEAALLTSAAVDRIYLFGYSGGAQFAHRYAMAHPQRVASVVIAAAGWYSFPDTRRRFPYGIRPHRHLSDLVLDPEEFLQVPMTVVIGARDGTRDSGFRTSARLDAQQGANRLERARNWVAAMQAAAAAYQVESRVGIVEVPGVAHSFRRFMRDGNLADIVMQQLFGRADAAVLPVPTVGTANGRGWQEAPLLADLNQPASTATSLDEAPARLSRLEDPA